MKTVKYSRGAASKLVSAIATACVGAALLSASVASADASCTALVQAKKDWADDPTHHGWWNVDLSIHAEWAPWVSYSSGYLRSLHPNTLEGGSFNQLFSDRITAGGQPFDVSRSDSMTFTLDTTGLLSIHNVTWGFDDSADFTCPGGNIMTKYTGNAVFTLTFRDWFEVPH